MKRKILVGLVAVLVLLVGSYSMLNVDKELMPSFEMDMAYVEVRAGDMAAIEVERTITTPLEQSIQGIEGVEEVTSTTAVGHSSLMVMIEEGKGNEVSNEIDSITHSTTSDIAGIDEVISGQVGSTSESYEFFMDISNGDMNEMTAFAQDILEPRLEELKEVRDVSLAGIQEHEMIVSFKRDEIAKRGLDVMQIQTIIQQSNSEATLGEFSDEKDAPSLRWDTKLESKQEIENLQIPTDSGFISLKDVADISLQPLKSSSTVWKNGTKDFIFVQIGRVPDVTQIDMADAVRQEVEKIEDEGLVKGFELNEMVAQADYVQESIDGVTNNILIGGIIAIVILLLFLRNVRATLIVGISIPTSILLTFISMWLLNYSFNILTLIGLGLGIGMMVDSSIVILESIYRKKEQGLKGMQAVLKGTEEVATAVIASMLTTIVVFLPIGLMGGEMGEFMILLSVVVAATLISSVIVSFTVIPSLSEKFLKLGKKKHVKENGFFIKGYSKLVGWVVKKKRNSIAILILFGVIFVSSLLLVPKIPMTVMPDVFNRYTEVLIDLETGISASEKEEVIQKLDETLSEVDDVETNYIMDNGGIVYAIINMTKGDDITKEQKDVNEDILSSLRDLQDEYPIEGVQGAMDAGSGYPVQVNITGESYEQLQSLAANFVSELEKVEGIVGISNSVEKTSVEQVIELKEAEIEKAGLSPVQIRQFIEQSYMNEIVGEVSNNDKKVPLRLKWDKEMNKQETLLNETIPTNDGDKKLSAFVELKSVEAPNEISHSDGERYVTISADIKDADLGTINREVTKVIDNFETPTGYDVEVAGDIEEQQELMQDMILILGIAIFLVYLVMAVQFNHLAHPIIVMSIIPMTIVGVILGLFITQHELNMMSGVGVIMLIGIVLNNAILLIDRINQLRKEGYEANVAVVEAGKNRIRPIFMTTLTTVGGMLPLALASGTSGNYQAPMATAIISGLLFATFITLLLIPAVYRIFHALGNGLTGKGKRKRNKNAENLSEEIAS
ncbi:HAE1 family hydrophobic/amphiphilic exporter-1 [Metabacillus malikii]|uniref:HAE1 family hydrophobic/amphiphilic exporter-1 n=1 Tax=Metabacillus malikii TaxID=1504265 RepID=A0ABT9ZHA5_9BACI|nr:HAE1 family hydrophobic/amphiphilic exporter-1 [Metabacillus malikii]